MSRSISVQPSPLHRLVRNARELASITCPSAVAMISRLALGDALSALAWPQTPIVLQNAKLIDGLADKPIEAAAVTIQHGPITSTTSSMARPAGNAGHYLSPGLIDAHAHLSDLKAARALIPAGVTTARARAGGTTSM